NLGWCTWDSFYTDLAGNRVLQGLRAFNAQGICPRTVILDDGWQDSDCNALGNGFQWTGRLASLDANYKFQTDFQRPLGIGDKFVSQSPLGCSVTTYDAPLPPDQHRIPPALLDPQYSRHIANGGMLAGSDTVDIHAQCSLEGVVRQSKRDHHVTSFMVWHTLTGFWNGVIVSPTSTLTPGLSTVPAHKYAAMSAYHPRNVSVLLPESVLRMSLGRLVEREGYYKEKTGLVHPDMAAQFFSDYHANLKGMGVDGVKVDAQSALPLMDIPDFSPWQLTSTFHRGLARSLRANFQAGSVIHCMCHSPQTLLSILKENAYVLDSEGRILLAIITAICRS
ncbi:MAG: hypothetical protein EOO61_09490, partial [Hymenobacter sp.]